MEKKLLRDYIFDASAKTIKSNEFTRLRRIAIITNVTTGDVIYDATDPTLGGTLSGTVLTVDFDTTAMNDTDDLQILLRVVTDLDRTGFAKAITNGVDPDFFTLVQTGTGMTVNQTAGDLIITSGATARAETIIRGKQSYSGGVRLKIQHLLSQRIANQIFIAELVDIVGDSLAYTINSATSITVTLPASFGLSAQNVGQSMTLCGFSGTGTFLSGRYPIASVSGNNATFTVSGFAAGTGTLSVVGWNYYRLAYTGTSATTAVFDHARNGYAYSQGDTDTVTTLTTATPGHIAIIGGNDGQAWMQDQVKANATSIQTNNRAARPIKVPDDANVYLQIRVLNFTTSPASSTTWTIGQISVGLFEAESVVVQDTRTNSFATAIPVEVVRTTSTSISGNVATTMAANATTTPAKAQDGAAGATDTGIPPLMVRRDAPTALTPVAGDYAFPQINNLGAQYVTSIAHTNGGAIPYKLVSAATTNATSVKATAGQVYSIVATNSNASARYLKLYNKASAPTVGTDTPVQVYMLPGNGGISLTLPVGMAFATGIALATTTGAADADTGAVALSEIVISLSYL